ncbi:velvet protein [Coccidioides posadasii str. Silveira]|uniref:Uncharacterized protein n=2 Tax=Coccidioides posadasii TaxID=199306 RepID=E9DI89_COCPS|nr:conserved hypothetical protein [Coccidioides posadasii C735 delta SOWgp]EER27940.1 conserved hypothetical protein [Coccidioides posadasii C735 delta SOWgp]EFW13885.1 conserved hypothetical protein [Coccidioides posadasii str. Silveira]QVM11288.1 velvet protein [Coccidioides posadasii str. Silveira]|eukprot:XP_003070085.1 conserved hypothetical protein [Coccidioides posadasii C735 delta SOWgp]
MSSKESILNPENETESSFVRTTREGKKLTYTLKVIQQPERARACGAGAKASADRRPVDPPPVVELRVYESDQNDMNKTDITFAYNANFFLFTTLEWARPIAHPRGQSQSAATPPVLTGVPVAGVAYLDRPVQAGYFIFPDLSVRHEGYYRLNFSLYEEVKDPKDEDKDRGVPRPVLPALPKTCEPREPNEYIYFRLDVKTTPFTVYSAKKFPGLAESTMLSRTVAEQGCRVRIRRDVRMRRREHKGNKDFNGGYDERHMTPDNYPGTPIERPRSASNASVDNPYVYCPTSTPRRVPSAQGFSYPPAPYQQPVAIPPPPPGPSPAPMAQSHLTFGAPQVQYSAPPASIPPVATQPPPALYSPRPAYAHNRQASSGSGLDAQAQKYPPTLPLKPDSTRPYLPPLLPTITSAYSSRVQDSPVSEPKGYSQLSQMPPPSPLHKASSSKPQYNLVPPTIIAADTTPAPPSNPPRTFDSARKMWAFDKQVLSGKRSHGETFGSAHLDRRLNDGARPDPLTEADSSDADAFSGHKVTYPRADGRLVERMAGMNA